MEAIMRKSFWIAAALVAAGSSGIVVAEDLTYGALNPAAPALKYDREFNRLDRDRDYTLDRSEAAARPDLGSQFETADANKNGVLDQAEFSVFEADAGATSSYNSATVPIRER
jgi:hypothetical protein